MSDTQSLLTTLAAESADLERILKATVTESVTGWANSQYLSAAHASLAATADLPQRTEIARRLARDWSFLRRADQRSERLRIDRLRVRLTKRHMDHKWSDKVNAGMREVFRQLNEDPAAENASNALDEYCRANRKSESRKEFCEWINEPETRKQILPNLLRGLSSETLQKVKHELHLEN